MMDRAAFGGFWAKLSAPLSQRSTNSEVRGVEPYPTSGAFRKVRSEYALIVDEYSALQGSAG